MPGKMARSDPRPSVRVTRGAGSGQHLASVLQEGREAANIDAGLGFIWRISAKMSVVDCTITGLEKAREQLVGLPKADLTHQAITKWCEAKANYNAIQAAEAGSMLLRRILHAVNGLNDAPPNVLDDARKNIVDHLDAAISKLDATRPVHSILEDRILRVKDTKLSKLLNEFNIHRE